MDRYISLIFLVLGYCLIRCASPGMAKPAHKTSYLDDNNDECNSKGLPCQFVVCPGDIFRAICDQFALVNNNNYPLQLLDVTSNSTCCKGKDCKQPGAIQECKVSTDEVVAVLKEATTCFTSPTCLIKHPEMFLKLQDKLCNMTQKMLTGYYYCN